MARHRKANHDVRRVKSFLGVSHREAQRIIGQAAEFVDGKVCPCGARVEDPLGWPHALGCPVGRVLELR